MTVFLKMKINVSKRNVAKAQRAVRYMRLINKKIKINKKVITDWKLCALRVENRLDDHNNEINFYMDMTRSTAFYLCERNRMDRINEILIENLRHQRQTMWDQITSIHRAVQNKMNLNCQLRMKLWRYRSLARKLLGYRRYPTPKPKDDAYNQAADPRYKLGYPRHFDNYLRCWLPNQAQHVRYYEQYPDVNISNIIVINPSGVVEDEEREDHLSPALSPFSDVTDDSDEPVDENWGHVRVDEMQMIDGLFNNAEADIVS